MEWWEILLIVIGSIIFIIAVAALQEKDESDNKIVIDVTPNFIVWNFPGFIHEEVNYEDNLLQTYNL